MHSVSFMEVGLIRYYIYIYICVVLLYMLWGTITSAWALNGICVAKSVTIATRRVSAPIVGARCAYQPLGLSQTSRQADAAFQNVPDDELQKHIAEALHRKSSYMLHNAYQAVSRLLHPRGLPSRCPRAALELIRSRVQTFKNEIDHIREEHEEVASCAARRSDDQRPENQFRTMDQ
jgi:hypothetical protein